MVCKTITRRFESDPRLHFLFSHRSSTPEAAKRLEGEIALLQTAKSPDKFRAEVIMLLADAFPDGFVWGTETKKEAIERGVSVLDLIGLGDKYKLNMFKP
jgi:hypothetical protein